MAQRKQRTRLLASVLAVLIAGSSMVPASADPIGDGVSPTYDEAYYATLDYYGNLLEGSVVKSYALNGADALTDYGTYDEVVNLTDGTPAVTGSGTTAFQFDQAPDHFYFEGKTAKPFQELPWTISLHYTLNGVPTRAEDLAGKTGVVEILMDVVPNKRASTYAQYNYTLAATAIFNQDDILSLEAPGAQVQLVGNLRTVLFLALPGEEQHFTIRVGSDDFSFSGMMVLMVPATLGQLEEIAKLSERKDDLEEDYKALSGSLDELLDALNDIQGGLYASANGLDQLDIARGTISDGKSLLYDDMGVLRGDLSDIADLLEPVEERIQVLSQTITDSKAVLTSLTDTAVSLKDQLSDLESALRGLEDGTSEVKDVIRVAADLEDSLRRLKRALDGTSIGGGTEIGSSKELVDRVKEVHEVYEQARGGDREKAFAGLLVLQGESASSARDKAAKAAPLAAALESGATEDQIIAKTTMDTICGMGLGVTPDTYQAFIQSEAGRPVYAQVSAQVSEQIRSQLPDVKKLEALYQAAKTLSFQSFCERLPGVSKEQAKQMNDLWIVYNSGSLTEGHGDDPVPVGGAALSAALRPSTDILSSTLEGMEREGSLTYEADAPAPEEGTDGGDSAGGETDGSDPAPDGEGGDTGGASGEDGGQGSGSSGESGTVGGAVVDLITGGLDSAVSQVNKLQSQLTGTMDKIARPTAEVVGDLADLCEELDDLTDLLSDAEDLSAALRQSTVKFQAILDDVDALGSLLDGYEPTLQEGLSNLGRISTSAVTTLRDLETLMGDAESLMKTSGSQLDAGTQATLQGLASALRQTARAMGATSGVRDAKTTITDIIEDTWNEYTGDVNNILMMDATADPVSLTDPRNPTPTSIQVLIRTQEIKVEEAPAAETEAAAKEETTFWGRIVQMFKDFWRFITGIFR